MSKKTIILITIIVLIFISGGVYLWQSQQPKDVIPEGVKIEIQNGKKLIKNELADYEVEVPSDWSIYGEKVERLEFFRVKEKNTNSETIRGCKVDINQENFEKQSLNEWIQKRDQKRLEEEKNEPSSTQIIEENNITLIDKPVLERIYEPPIGPIYKEIYLLLEEKGKVLILRETIGITSSKEKKQCEEEMKSIIESLTIL